MEKMESDLGKLFIGGISWETDEHRLKEYFGHYGEVVEAVIMRDRVTGRARGFGFIVFVDPGVAKRVVMEKHMIDGRIVEAKKAVPRDDQQILSRNTNSIQGSPGKLGRTKKIFVGGLASTVSESDFKNYFEEFGDITDVVVMYDHNTQRPRGFGFITYDSEDAVDRVLHKTFHELNGKMVEVKRAIPKELSPGPSRSPLVGYNYGMSRASNFINNYAQGYNLSTIGEYGRLSPLVTGRSGLPPFGNFGYGMGMGMGMGMEPGMNAGYNANSSFNNSPNYSRILGPYYNGNSKRYNTPIGYSGGSERVDSFGNLAARNLPGNGSFSNSTNPASLGSFMGFGSRNIGVSFGNGESDWDTSLATTQTGVGGSRYSSGNLGNGFGDDSYGMGSGNYGRSHITELTQVSSSSASTRNFDTSYGDPYHSGSAYGDSTWCSGSPVLDVSGSFGFGIGNTAGDVASKASEGFMGSYNLTNRQANRGIAA